MFVNISSPSNSSLHSVIFDCYNSTVTLAISTAFNIIKTLLLLPLSTLILYLGHQRWRQQHSFTTTSHSDIFTYHVAVIELIWFLGIVFFSYGSSVMRVVGPWLISISQYGEGYFHLLTCVERYLAVVHPVTYLGLRKAGGVRIRNISIGCVWLLSVGLSGGTLYNPDPAYPLFFSSLVFSLLVVSFCSLSVLCVLIRPGPGQVGGDKERIDQSKQRAFYTIMAITGVQWFGFLGFLVTYSLSASPLVSDSVGCVAKASAGWFDLPTSLVLPLLYIQRARKLSCCCHKSG